MKSKDFDSDIKKWLQEAYQKSLSDIPASIGKPARRALTAANITALDQVAELSDKKLLALHGVGPKAVRILREYIKENSKDNSWLEKVYSGIYCAVCYYKNMNLFHSYKFSWKQLAAFKIALISIGMIIGAYIADLVKSYIWLIGIVAAVSSIYIVFIALKQNK